jgi:replicative DNA helicase
MNERVANISKAIKQLQVSRHIPIVSVSQMNRTKNEDDSQDTTQIGLSDRIGQDATTVIMLSRDEDKLILNIVKARDGGDGKKLTYQADLNKGLFNFIPDENSQVVSDEELDSIRDSYSVDYCG